jgi:hypothetical protein
VDGEPAGYLYAQVRRLPEDAARYVQALQKSIDD